MAEGDSFTPIPKNLQFRVGLLLGLTFMVAAGFILYALYARGLFEATQRLILVSDNAEGVYLGMDLTFSGFPIGRVERISLADDGRARIAIEVPRNDAKWLRTSSIFTLERGIVGGARIRAFTGNLQDPPLPDGAERQVLRGDTQEEIPRMVATLRSTLENIEQITGPGGSLQMALGHLRTVTERVGGRHGALGAVLGNEADAKKVMAAIERANALLASMSGVVAKADQRILGSGGVVEGAQRAFDQANAILTELRESLKRVDRILADAQSVTGNAKAASSDLAALRAEVDASLRKVSGLIDEINRKWPFQRDSEIRLP
jgi:phospholipid/cholesterol/gamma-HCH transport system substrate-binding protein